MPEVDFETWKTFVSAHAEIHVLQTAEWGELKKGFGWDVARLIVDDLGVQILFRRLPLGFTVAYLPKPIEGEVRPTVHLLQSEIDSVCRKHHAIFIKLEPDVWQDQSITFNLQPSTISPHNIQPPRTIIISLEGSEEDVLARMKQKCRYNVRLAEKKGITVRAWDDLYGFHRLMQVTGGRDGFGVHSLAYYKKAYDLFHPTGMAELLVAEFEGRPLAALMIFAIGKRSWYLYGASNDEERNRMPTYLLQWEAILWAKARGCTEYDLWGVPDADEETLEAEFESRHDGLWGVYRFKRGFGGQVKRAAQTLDKVYMPLLYKLYLWRMGKSGE